MCKNNVYTTNEKSMEFINWTRQLVQCYTSRRPYRSIKKKKNHVYKIENNNHTVYNWRRWIMGCAKLSVFVIRTGTSETNSRWLHFVPPWSAFVFQKLSSRYIETYFTNTLFFFNGTSLLHYTKRQIIISVMIIRKNIYLCLYSNSNKMANRNKNYTFG